MNFKKCIPNSEGIIEVLPLTHWLNKPLEGKPLHLLNGLRYFWIKYDMQICISVLILIALISLSGG